MHTKRAEEHLRHEYYDWPQTDFLIWLSQKRFTQDTNVIISRNGDWGLDSKQVVRVSQRDIR